MSHSKSRVINGHKVRIGSKAEDRYLNPQKPRDRFPAVQRPIPVPRPTRPNGPEFTSREYGTPSNFKDYRSNTRLDNQEFNRISNSYSSRLRSEMDLINSKFNQVTNQQREINRGELARTKTLNANTGLIDSGTGAAAQGQTEVKGAEAIKALDEERAASLSSAVGKIDELKQSAIAEATAQQQNDLTAYNELRSENTSKAEDAIKTFIEGGGDVEALKKDGRNSSGRKVKSSFDILSAAVGGEGRLKALAIAYQPKDTYVSDKPEIIGNRAIWFKKNAKTGKITQEVLDLPKTGGGKSIKQIMRVPGEATYIFYTDGSFTEVGQGGSTVASELSDSIATVAKQLEARVGADGKVSPEDYKRARAAWLSAGLQLKDFDSNFKKFINYSHVSDYEDRQGSSSSSGGP